MAGNVRLVEATGPRELILRLLVPARALRLAVRYPMAEARRGFTARSAITHRMDVRRFAARKQAALAAHRSQVYGRGRSGRLLRLLVRLPVPVFGLIAGREWFAEPGAPPGPVRDHVLTR
jgi:hypothetical protein